jgi:alpha(1,3/1,4) fucosyltransferase
MRTLKILFVDFWPGWNPESNPLVEVLRKHFVVELSNQPDFIIYSNFGYRYLGYDLPRLYYTGEDLRPDFNLCDYALGCDRMTFGDRYFRFPTYMMDMQPLLRGIGARTYDFSPRRFCNFVYSNPHADPARDTFFRLLSAYKKVDSAGRHLNNTGFRTNDKAAFQRQYKFSIAFENASTRGYVSEKIIQAYAAGTVPIYWGDPDIGLDFNPESFVNCLAYPSLETAVERVVELDNDEEAYARTFEAPFFRGPMTEYAIEPGLEEFLVRVFSQDREKAFRRSRQAWGKVYETQKWKSARYIERLQTRPMFGMKEHLFMYGAFATIKKVRERMTEKKQEKRESRLRNA